MNNLFKINNTRLLLLVIFFYLTTLFFFQPNYGADTFRYVFAGKQLIEIFFEISLQPRISETFESSINFHKNTDYTFPTREFFTIIPNIIFYLFSLFLDNGVSYIFVLNTLCYSSLFVICHKKYNKECSFAKFLIIFYLFFGHYQIAGWNIKILPEIMYFCTLLIFLIIFTNHCEKLTLSKIILLLFLSVSIFLIRPQGLIFISTLIIFLCLRNFFQKNLFKFFLIFFILIIFITPLILYLDINKILNIPVISINNTGLLDGAIISGWINYYEGNLIYQELRFNDKKLNLSQSYSYFDLLKITLLRLFYYLIPIRYFQPIYLNVWNIIYFFSLYIFSIIFFIKSENKFKKNIFTFMSIGILSFHLLFPITGTFRYQLTLIALLFVISFELLKLKKNEQN